MGRRICITFFPPFYDQFLLQSQSSVLTDDEGKDTYFGNGVMEETIRSIYARKVHFSVIYESYTHHNWDLSIHYISLGLRHIFQAKQPNGGVVDNGGLYEAMRKELRHAVEEIRVELEQVREILLIGSSSTLH